VSVCVY
jgi:hypothetical protein